MKRRGLTSAITRTIMSVLRRVGTLEPRRFTWCYDQVLIDLYKDAEHLPFFTPIQLVLNINPNAASSICGANEFYAVDDVQKKYIQINVMGNKPKEQFRDWVVPYLKMVVRHEIEHYFQSEQLLSETSEFCANVDRDAYAYFTCPGEIPAFVCGLHDMSRHLRRLGKPVDKPRRFQFIKVVEFTDAMDWLLRGAKIKHPDLDTHRIRTFWLEYHTERFGSKTLDKTNKDVKH